MSHRMSSWQGTRGPIWRGDARRVHAGAADERVTVDALMRAIVEAATATIGVPVGNNVWFGASIVHRDRDHRSRETDG